MIQLPENITQNKTQLIEMSNKKVTACIVNKENEVLALCNPFEDWSFRKKEDVIQEIENDFHAYYLFHNGKKVNIFVINGDKEKHLHTNPYFSERNLLLYLDRIK